MWRSWRYTSSAPVICVKTISMSQGRKYSCALKAVVPFCSGYAADGYARACGVGACAVTFTVGGLSVINAIAGAYSENLPVICIVGGPNSNDFGTNRILHHTIGLPDFSQELHCFQQVTCAQVRAFPALSMCWAANPVRSFELKIYPWLAVIRISLQPER